MTEIFRTVLQMSVSASWLILAVLLLRVVLGKASKGFRYILWAFVAIRLICPWSIESSLSLVPDFSQIGVEESDVPNIPDNVGLQENTNIQTDENIQFDESVQSNGNAQSNEIVQSNGSTQSNEIVQSNGNTQSNEVVQSNGNAPENVQSNETVQANGNVSMDEVSSRSWEELLDEAIPWVWATDGILMLVYIVISYLVLGNKVKVSIPVGDQTYICDGIRSPFIFGIVRPRIYVPSSITKEQMVYIMSHEKEHMRCLDYLWKPLGFVILSIHWFNPLVWVAYICMCRDLELACDERVIRNMSATEKRNYSETLLACSSPRSYISACPVAFGEVGIKERIKRVLSYKKPALWIVVIAVVACVITAVCFLTNPKTTEAGGIVDSESETEAGTETKSGNGTETESNIETESDVENDTDLNLMQKVLLNQAELHDGKRITDIEGIYCENEEEQERVRYQAVDLDGDGINEVSVRNAQNEIIIFHEINGKVYYYHWNGSDISTGDIHEDGTIASSNTYGDAYVYEPGDYWTYYGNVSFTETDMSYDVIASTWCDEAGNVHYYKDGEHGQPQAVEIDRTEYNYRVLNYEISRESSGAMGQFTEENIRRDITIQPVRNVFPITDVSEEDLSLMQKVLLNMAEFNHGQKIEDAQWLWYPSEYDMLFYVVDLDHDGNDEVIIYDLEVLILHEENNQIYAYTDTHRAYSPLYSDGTSMGSSGAAFNCLCGNVSFDNYEYIQNTILYVDSWDASVSGKEEDVRYYKDGTDADGGIRITREEFKQILSQYPQEEATSYVFSLENILEYVD